MEVLTVIEKSEFTQLEDTIQKGLKTFYEVGFALMQIRDNRYYREKYSTFELYCKERWNISRPRAYELMKAAEVKDNLSAIADIKNEAQARPLTKLSPDQQREVYEEAVETAPEGKVTAKHIEQVIKDKRPRINVELPKIGDSFKKAWVQLVEEIKKENLNGWKYTDKAEAIQYIHNLVDLII